MTFPRIIDAHTHIQASDYASDRDAVIARARDEGIGMILAGADEEMSRDAVTCAHAYPFVWATVGYHPHEVEKHIDFSLVETLARDERVVGIGECGLDYFKLDKNRANELKEKQRELFEKHIALAHEVGKPLVIHCRDAFDDVLMILEKHRDLLLPIDAGICHFFTGTADIAQRFLALGFSFTFGGLITFNRSFDSVIASIPIDRVLVETDAPWVAPLSHRGSRNESSYISETISFLANIYNCSPRDMEKQLLENTIRVFGLKE